MTTKPTLLTVHEGKTGSFIKWLEKLGLGDFLKHHSLSELVEWGWVVPQYRVNFPKDFFESWKNYPAFGGNIPKELEDYSVLWDYFWFLDDESKPHWYLDPIFHPGDKAGELLRNNIYKAGSCPIPAPFVHPCGISITPYVDYFFRWQGYALIDVIRFADNIESVYSTPDIVKRAQGFMRIAE